MNTLTRPRPRVVSDALGLARGWCVGHTIDGAPAIVHAVRVARKLVEHLPNAVPELIAAVLVHDAPLFAPIDIDLDAVLGTQLGAEVARIVRAIEREHIALTAGSRPAPPLNDPHTLLAIAADKIVSITSIVRRSTAAPDPAEYWANRSAFTGRLPYFHDFSKAVTPHLPASLAAELETVVRTAMIAADLLRSCDS